MSWLETFRGETRPTINEPFFLCLAEAIAAVESGFGDRAVAHNGLLNEIGYKAVPHKPSIFLRTREAAANGAAAPAIASFRLFINRREQAAALMHLFRTSQYYESARLFYVLALYSAYAPGRTEGLREVLKVFNQIARTGAHTGVQPFKLIETENRTDAFTHNYTAARAAIHSFANLTAMQ